MVQLHLMADNVLQLKVEGKLTKSDFATFTPQIDALLSERGNLRLLVDATTFEGWESAQVAAWHFAFVRDHHSKISRVAVIAGHIWQHWLAALASVFVRPEVRVFDAHQSAEAYNWTRS